MCYLKVKQTQQLPHMDSWSGGGGGDVKNHPNWHLYVMENPQQMLLLQIYKSFSALMAKIHSTDMQPVFLSIWFCNKDLEIVHFIIFEHDIFSVP